MYCNKKLNEIVHFGKEVNIAFSNLEVYNRIILKTVGE
jgi:hypothetical protein